MTKLYGGHKFKDIEYTGKIWRAECSECGLMVERIGDYAKPVYFKPTQYRSFSSGTCPKQTNHES